MGIKTSTGNSVDIPVILPSFGDHIMSFFVCFYIYFYPFSDWLLWFIYMCPKLSVLVLVQNAMQIQDSQILSRIPAPSPQIQIHRKEGMITLDLVFPI